MYNVFVGTNPGIWGLGIRERIVVTAKCYILDQGRTTAAAAEDSAQPGEKYAGSGCRVFARTAADNES